MDRFDGNYMNQALSRINYNRQFVYASKHTLASITDSNTQIITIGNNDFLLTQFVITGRDSDGDVLHLATSALDVFTLSIKDETSMNYENIAHDLFSLNSIPQKGMLGMGIYQARKQYSIKVAGDNFPGSNKNTYPVQIYVELHGYEILPQ
jgi:hypothetical protein